MTLLGNFFYYRENEFWIAKKLIEEKNKFGGTVFKLFPQDATTLIRLAVPKNKVTTLLPILVEKFEEQVNITTEEKENKMSVIFRGLLFYIIDVAKYLLKSGIKKDLVDVTDESGQLVAKVWINRGEKK